MISQRIQRGLSLLELTMVIGIIAILITSSIAFFNGTTDSRKAVELQRNITTISTNIRNMFAAQGDYVGITNEVVRGGTNFPPSMRGAADDEIDHPWGDASVDIISVDINGADDGFQIELLGIPTDICVDLTTRIYREFEQVDVEGNTITQVADAAPECTGGPVDIQIIGR